MYRRIGKTIVISGQQCDDTYQNCQAQQQALVVTGILQDLPHNTQFEADVMIPNTSAAVRINQEMRENWLWLRRAGAMSAWRPGPTPTPSRRNSRTVIDHVGRSR